jgi:hypothetical protein
MDPANKLATSATTFSGMISSLLLAKLANHREILRSSCHKKATALLPISRQKPNLFNPIYLRNKFLGLPCLTLLCSRLSLIRCYPLLPSTIVFLHVPAMFGKQLHRSQEDLVFGGLFYRVRDL